VFGFLPYWDVSGASTRLNYDVLSTIAYFSVGVDKAGNLKKRDADGTKTTGWGGWTSSSMTSVINAAHQRGTRVVLTVSAFAWTSTTAAVQKAVLGSSAARLTLARQAAAAVRDRGADGVNLDFEPLVRGYEDEFVSLLRTMRSELNRIRSGYQLTYDTTGFIGNYPLEASVASGAADAIFVMGYDYRTGSSATAGSIDPLSGPRYDLADTVRAYTARVSPSRVILGLPWYGRAWSTATDDARSENISGAKYGHSTAVTYENVVGLVDRYGRRWDSLEQSPYVAYRRQNCTSTYGCVTSWRQVYYDDASSLKRRYEMINDYGLRGTGIWALGYDGGHSELYRALSDSFLVDSAAPRAGIEMLTTTQADEGFVVSWAARDTSKVASYDVQVSVDGGAWATWRTGTKATSDVWLGSDGHGYAFRVRATDSKGNTSAWNVTAKWDASPGLEVGGFGRVVQDGLAYRTGPGTDSAKLGGLDAGTIVAVTRGPVSADGYTWFEVTQPIREWVPVSFVERGVWVAARSSTDVFVKAFRAPNSTTVAAGLRDLDFGPAGTSNVGTTASAVAARRFSPNGDESRDALRIRWTNDRAMDAVVARVHRADGSLVGTRALPDLGAGAQAWDWNGRVDGVVVPDGRYLVQLVGTAGDSTYSAPSRRPVTSEQLATYGVVVDTVAPVVSSASASTALISPNGDGRLDAVSLAMTATGATRWTVRVTDPGGEPVRTASGTGARIAFSWAGTSDSGSKVTDGRYRATLALFDDAGNSAQRSFAVVVDTTPPAVTPGVSEPIFSPNGDGARDTTRLSFRAGEPVTGRARIWKDTTLVRSWSVSGVDAWAATWDGRTSSGSRAPDGRYTFKVTVRDVAGNLRTTSTTVVVDRTGSTLRWSRPFYPQDADALRRTSVLSWTLSRDATTTLRLYDAAGTLVRTAWSGKAQAAGTRSWTWDGRASGGAWAPQGRYEARLAVTSRLGTLELRRTVWATAFVIRPSATTVKPGQTLTVRFTTVEPLSSRPVVRFEQPGRSAVSVTATRLSDGSYRASFTVRSGSAGSGTVTVRAKDTGGGVNRTSIPIRVVS
jgi:spore germination protein YaaH/flagellar hook assembly protein FlgD